MGTKIGTKRPDVIIRNKSKEMREAQSLSWKNEDIRKSRIEKLKKVTGKIKATYGHKGKKHTEETREKIRKIMIGKYVNENHIMWKGEESSYHSKHSWVSRKRGVPQECSKCGAKKTDVVIQWANIDHQYRRNLDDYIPLCPKCHTKYDIEKGLRKFRFGKDNYNYKRKFTDEERKIISIKTKEGMRKVGFNVR